MNIAHITKFSITLALGVLFAHTAEAASLFLVPSSGEFGVGAKITVDLKIDSEGTGLNAGQATIRFPKETLTVTSVDKTGSTFNFWLEEPTFSNEDGVISFIGGTPYGMSGASIQVLRITFTSKGSGTPPVTIVDAAVTASDGSGTNILSKTTDATFTISPRSGTPAAPSAPVIVPAPTQIVREPTPAAGLPAKPALTVPLYSNSAEWYNVTNTFTAQWGLPSDISGVATLLNRQPSSIPEGSSEGLFDNKTFNALSDGIWYLHVRFRNNIGWGPTVHYRLAVDTQPPLPFEITSRESEMSDVPNPTLSFRASDALSGVKEYQIRVNNEPGIVIPAKNFPGEYQLHLANPGKHNITIKAVDLAGNSIENNIEHETIPLTAPSFTFVTEKLYSDEPKGLTVKGSALPSTEILFTLKTGESVVTSTTLQVDTQGNWEYTFSDLLRNGTYVVSIQNRDARGALSFVIDSPKITVSNRYGTVLILLFVILIGSLAAGFWFYKTRREKTALRIDVAESDTAKAFNMIKADIDKLDKARTTETTVDDEFITQKMRENVKKMETYVKKEIIKAKE